MIAQVQAYGREYATHEVPFRLLRVEARSGGAAALLYPTHANGTKKDGG